MTSYKGSNTTINTQQVPSHNTFDQDTTTNPKSWGGLIPFQVENDVELLVKVERRSEAIPEAPPSNLPPTTYYNLFVMVFDIHLHPLQNKISWVMLAVRLMFTVQLGTPRGRYDEYSSKVFPQ
jgi:hypothetical protein